MKKKIKLLFKLLSLMKPLTPVMLGTITFGTIGFLASMFLTILGGYALLNVFGVETGIANSTIFVTVVVLAVVLSFAKYLEQLSGHYVAFKVLALLRDKVFGALRRLAPAKLEGRDKGNMISIITADIEYIEVFYAHTIAPVTMGVICSLIMAGFIGSYHYILGIIALVFYAIIGFVIPYINTRTGKPIASAYRKGFGNLNAYILESLRGLREVIQYNQGDNRRNAIKDQSNAISAINKKLKNREGNEAATTDTVILVAGLTVLATSLGLLQAGEVGIEAVVIATIAMLGSFAPVIALSSLSNDLVQMLASAERVFGILEEEPVVEDIRDKEELDAQGLKEIRVDNVSFAYGPEKVLDKVSLSLPKNKIIGIHGVSGSGKSTLLKLLMRFWSVKEGKILFNDGQDKDINEVNTHSLRRMESLVTQETYLFHDTIKNNIKIAKPGATDAEVIAAAKKASIHDFIVSLPQGYDTQVSELGSSLSGGERQRIGVARAFLHESPIMLLDEPTSNLDSLNEGIILKSLKEECKEKTVILVSHRKSTLNISDITFAMDCGRIS